MIDKENPDCDGAGKHSGSTVKRYPIGGDGDAILCFSCWVAENRYRYERGKELGQDPALWPQQNWYDADPV